MARSTSKSDQPLRLRNAQKSKAGVRKKRRHPAKRSRVRKGSYTYTYAPLQYADSIRLLTLFAGDFDSPIEISLAAVRSQDGYAYEALSYAWATEDGDCRRSSQIKCEGARIWVTKNCELALRYLRKADKKRVLWVDAICINQKDFKERGHQVGIMREVYSKATEVLIWLGEASKHIGLPLNYAAEGECSVSISSSALGTNQTTADLSLGRGSSSEELNSRESQRKDSNTTQHSVSEIFLEFLGKMGDDITRIENAGQDPQSSPLYSEIISQISLGPWSRTETSLSRGFHDIVSRRWWSRVWVVQEVVVAKSAMLICSRQSTNYSNLYILYRLLRCDFSTEGLLSLRYFGSALSHLRSVKHGRSANGASDQTETLLNILPRVRRLTASNPRDTVFGVLGLSEKFKTLLPLPDYKKTTTEVFTDVAKSVLNQTKSLSLLEHATSAKPVSDHPSWVPSWSNPPVMPTSVGCNKSKAGGNSEVTFEISFDAQELRVKGKEFDRAKTLPLADLGAYKYYSSFEQRIESVRKSCDAGFSLTKYPTGESVEEALWRSLCWNTDFQQCTPAAEEIVYSFRGWHRILTSIDTFENIVKGICNEEGSFENIVKYSTPLCITAKGYLAAVPYTTEVGDCIALLAGGRLPFVLRSTGDHYRLVGPCYVHGIMNGEAFPEDPKELSWFSIR